MVVVGLNQIGNLEQEVGAFRGGSLAPSWESGVCCVKRRVDIGSGGARGLAKDSAVDGGDVVKVLACESGRGVRTAKVRFEFGTGCRNAASKHGKPQGTSDISERLRPAAARRHEPTFNRSLELAIDEVAILLFQLGLGQDIVANGAGSKQLERSPTSA